jgi:hypothetical protein
MAVQSRTESIDNLYTTTWQNMKSDVADQIYSATPFYFWLKNKGNLDPIPGGRFIAEPLRYAKSDNIRWVKKGSTMPLADKEFLTEAIWEWRYLADSIVRFGVDDQQNRGRNQIIDLALAKMQNSRDSLIDALETTLFTAQTGNEMNGLPDIIADDPSTGTTGGINSATHDWWRNQEFDFDTDGGGTFVAKGQGVMSNMLNLCSNNLRQDTPDLIVSGQVPYEDYEELSLVYQRIVNKELADAGFTHQVFKGIPMVWSPAAGTGSTNNRMYFVNTRFMRLKYDPQMNFDMTEWKPIPDQIQDRAAQVIFAGNLVTNRRKVQGVIHNIDS